jgi:hypothetical protein
LGLVFNPCILFLDTFSDVSWITQADITDNSQQVSDISITDNSENTNDYERFVGYVHVDGLIAYLRCCVGSTRLLGMDLIPRYRVDIDFDQRPNRPFELTKQRNVNDDQ